MRPLRLLPLALAAGLAACADGGPGVERAAPGPLSPLDAQGLDAVMLAVAEPEEAVAHFQRAVAARPADPEALRGLATALAAAGRHDDAAPVWRSLAGTPAATPDDRVALAEAAIRTGGWDEAREALAEVPEGHATGRRFRLEAMTADAAEDWASADRFYGRAVELTPEPSGVLNNWGYSKLSRGDEAGAERLFERALEADPALFHAKNNLALARGARGHYEVPLVPMTQTERATVLHTLALAAVKRGDVAIGRELLRDSVETHPQHFEAAATALAALDAGAPAGGTRLARAEGAADEARLVEAAAEVFP